MPQAKARKNRHISHILRFAVAAGALYLVFRGENFKEVTEVLLGLNLWIFAAALGIYLFSQLIFVVRWRLLLKVQSIEIGLPVAIKLHFLGLFYNNCLPGSVGGDLLRAWYVTKHTDKKLQAALSVFVDRVVGLTGMLIMAFFCYWFIPAQNRPDRSEPELVGVNPLHWLAEYKWVFVAIAAAFVVAAVVFVSSAGGRGLLRRCLQFVRCRSVIVLGKVRDAIRIYWNKKLALLCALLLTFCCQSIFIMALLLLGREIGITANTKYYFIFFPISWLLGALPISVGGAGIMEWWLKVMFIRVCAVSSKNSLVLALCQRLLWLFGSLPGVAIHLMGAHLPGEPKRSKIPLGTPKDFFVDSDKSIK